MKLWILFAAVVVLSIIQTSFYFTATRRTGVNAEVITKLDQVEADLAQAQQDIGEMKQEIMILLKRDNNDDD